jgi:serine/threonine protein kinase
MRPLAATSSNNTLKRQVAIEVLPPSLAADHDRLARFQCEAEVLASLNHPHIAGHLRSRRRRWHDRARGGTKSTCESVLANDHK